MAQIQERPGEVFRSTENQACIRYSPVPGQPILHTRVKIAEEKDREEIQRKEKEEENTVAAKRKQVMDDLKAK